MHKYSLFRFFLIIIISILTLSCSKLEDKKQKSETSSTKEKINSTEIKTNIQKNIPIWYYFSTSNTGDLILTEELEFDNIPKVAFKPWTEAMRIVDIGTMYSPPVFLINKGGIIETNDISKKNNFITQDIFKEKTVDGFYKTTLGTVIRLYTNTIFSTLNENYKKNDFCLYRYNSVNKSIMPLISSKIFGLSKKAQMTSLEYNNKWYTSFKTEVNEKVSFNYFSFKDINEIKGKKFSIENQDNFIKNTHPTKLSENNISNSTIEKKILSSKHENIKLELNSNILKKNKILIKNKRNNNEDTHIAFAAEFQNGINSNKTEAILFNDGEIIYTTDSKSWIKKTLPKLPKNFVYTYIIIEKNIMFIGWEEQVFFQIGRSGILKILY